MTNDIKPLSNAEIDAHPLLDQSHRLWCKAMRTGSRKHGKEFSMLAFARICLHATAVDYANAEDDELVLPSKFLQESAVMFVYEALKACDHEIIRQWPEFDTMLKCLEDLVNLGLPK